MTAATIEGLSGWELVGVTVRSAGIPLGRVADLLLDRELERVVGFEVDCGGGDRRFLALGACTVSPTELSVVSEHALVDSAGLFFYRERSTSLRELIGRSLDRRGAPAGVLEDVLVRPTGEVERLVLRHDGARRVLTPHELDWRASVE